MRPDFKKFNGVLLTTLYHWENGSLPTPSASEGTLHLFGFGWQSAHAGKIDTLNRYGIPDGLPPEPRI